MCELTESQSLDECRPSAALRKREAERFARVSGSPDLVLKHIITDRNGAPVAATHVMTRKRIVLNIVAPDDDAQDAVITVAVEGEVRFRWNAFYMTIMAGGPNVWARLACEGTRCLVVAGYFNTSMRGVTADFHVSAPFDLADPSPFVASDACVEKRRVSVVANPELVSTMGQRAAAALRKAGCVVRGPAPARALRSRSTVFARSVEDAAATALAGGFDADVALLTWDAKGDVVLALGAPG
jgi:hypothetical protein